MTAWSILRRVSTALLAFTIVCTAAQNSSQGAGIPSAETPGADDRVRDSHDLASQSVTQLRVTAGEAEKAGDWEVAFSAYCRLFLLERSAPEIRDKLNVALRRAQQQRRHRDPSFQLFVASTSISDALNLYTEIIARVPAAYVDRNRSRPQQLWESSIEELARALTDPVFRQAFCAADCTEQTLHEVEVFRAGLQTWSHQEVNDSRSARTMLRKLITSAQEATTIRLPSALVLEMVCGACNGLDEYTGFLNPSPGVGSVNAAAVDLTAQGINLSFTEEWPVVSGIVSGSWVALMNPQIRKGDHLLRVNGHAMERATPAVLASALRAPLDKGHLHSIEIAGMTPEDMPLEVQLPVAVPTVFGARVLTVKDGKDAIGYARIGNFGPSTPRELDEAIGLLKTRDGVRALVLDLRGNMGGSFLACIETARRLIPSGLIVTTQGQLSEVANQPFSSDSGMTAHDLPIVVLIDGETASAAEVLAAALKDNNRATLVGMPTFGKGTIQYPLRLLALDELDDAGKPKGNRSGTVRLTIARLIAPRGGAIDGVGVTPHLLEADVERQIILAQEKAIQLLQMAESGDAMIRQLKP